MSSVHLRDFHSIHIERIRGSLLALIAPESIEMSLNHFQPFTFYHRDVGPLGMGASPLIKQNCIKVKGQCPFMIYYLMNFHLWKYIILVRVTIARWLAQKRYSIWSVRYHIMVLWLLKWKLFLQSTHSYCTKTANL